MKDLLLVYPIEDASNHPPLGLAYLAAVARDRGWRVHAVVRHTAFARRSDEDIVREALALRPAAVAMTVFDAFSLAGIYRLAAALKSAVPAALVAGGPHATLLPDEVLGRGFDIAVRGEGESTFRELLDACFDRAAFSGIAGISWRTSEGAVVHNPDRPLISDLDSLPYPDKSVFSAYGGRSGRLSRKVFGNVCSARGCPARCLFCSKTSQEKKVRFRSPENVLGEMLELASQWNVNSFYFVDDTFASSRRRTLELCGLVRSRPELAGCRWNCQTRADTVDRELLRAMKGAGCEFIIYGVETGDPAMQKALLKGIDLERAEESIRLTKEEGLGCYVNMMYGFPGETLESLGRTFGFIKRTAPFVDVFSWGGVLIPHPGTEVYERHKDEYGFAGWWLDPRYARHGNDRVYNLIGYYCDGVLDLDFFRYPAPFKAAIRSILRFIAGHNLRALPPAKRLAKWTLANASIALSSIHPALDAAVLGPVYRYGLRRLRESQ